MERLTRRSADGRACFKPHLYGQMNKDVCDRLAAYEDTGLEPEDLKRAFNEDDVLKLAGQALGITPERLHNGHIFYQFFYCTLPALNTKLHIIWCPFLHAYTVHSLFCLA